MIRISNGAVTGREAVTRTCKRGIPTERMGLEAARNEIEYLKSQRLNSDNAKIAEGARKRVAELEEALEEFEGVDLEAARREVSRAHPDHGGEGSEAFTKALSKLRKAKQRKAT